MNCECCNVVNVRVVEVEFYPAIYQNHVFVYATYSNSCAYVYAYSHMYVYVRAIYLAAIRYILGALHM